MNRAPLCARARLRQLLLCFQTILVLAAAAAAQATGDTDGLSIGGSTQWAAIAGRPYVFTPTVANPSGHTLKFGIANKPAWATLDTATGRLSGTATGSGATYGNILIAVTDGQSTAVTTPFFIRVYPPDTFDKPLLSGSPAAGVTAGSPYAFQPSARDVYGQPLSFSVKNKPAWASFSISTGLLYGIPASADAGTYGGVEISATNGEATSTLPAFSIAVGVGATSGTGNATLSWQPPTANTDGSALTDLAGTRIFYGTAAGNLSHVVEVPGPAETSYTIADLSAGTWYFALAAYTTQGAESAQSAVVSASIP
jgi:Putative Ig domain